MLLNGFYDIKSYLNSIHPSKPDGNFAILFCVKLSFVNLGRFSTDFINQSKSSIFD